MKISSLFLICSELVGREIHYKYGGNTPSEGLDCSGMVCHILKEVGYFPKDAPDRSSQMLYDYFTTVKHLTSEPPSHGCLLFFGKTRTKITHIAVAMNEFMMCEAHGTSECLTKEFAKKHDFRIKYSRIDKRRDLVASINIGV